MKVPTITVCRGCCCGTHTKHPGVDHAARLEHLRDLAHGVAQVRTADCLGPCERSDVVVVAPSAAGRRAGARTVWIGRIGPDHVLADIASWVAEGGPGFVEPPPSVAARTFRYQR